MISKKSEKKMTAEPEHENDKIIAFLYTKITQSIFFKKVLESLCLCGLEAHRKNEDNTMLSS